MKILSVLLCAASLVIGMDDEADRPHLTYDPPSRRKSNDRQGVLSEYKAVICTGMGFAACGAYYYYFKSSSVMEDSKLLTEVNQMQKIGEAAGNVLYVYGEQSEAAGNVLYVYGEVAGNQISKISEAVGNFIYAYGCKNLACLANIKNSCNVQNLKEKCLNFGNLTALIHEPSVFAEKEKVIGGNLPTSHMGELEIHYGEIQFFTKYRLIIAVILSNLNLDDITLFGISIIILLVFMTWGNMLKKNFEPPEFDFDKKEYERFVRKKRIPTLKNSDKKIEKLKKLKKFDVQQYNRIDEYKYKLHCSCVKKIEIGRYKSNNRSIKSLEQINKPTSLDLKINNIFFDNKRLENTKFASVSEINASVNNTASKNCPDTRRSYESLSYRSDVSGITSITETASEKNMKAEEKRIAENFKIDVSAINRIMNDRTPLARKILEEIYRQKIQNKNKEN